ncbi:MAG: anthranilate synthase component I [Planctomycetaceae bacterium]|nr:anthranilate synthase component I [Planctomycetaceae bacterium]
MTRQKPDFDTFQKLARTGNLVPIYRELMSDHLTPVLAYRRLVQPDDRHAPSFLLESVIGGDRVGRYSFIGAQPIARIVAYHHTVSIQHGPVSRKFDTDDPLAEVAKLTQQCNWNLVRVPELPDFTGGWVGYAGYDTVRYVESEKLPDAPSDDRNLPDLDFALYRQIVAFDHVRKTVLAIDHVCIDDHPSVEAAYEYGCRELDDLVNRFETAPVQLAAGDAAFDVPPAPPSASNMTRPQFEHIVEQAKQYITAGDIFQVVLAQRFERITSVDPFDIYRALRVVNPSPYMFYLQAEGCMLVGSSPEILCRVDDRVITNRPLAGTRRRGKTDTEDKTLEAELLADPKERAEHIMLVDLGRNDVGKVAQPGSIDLPAIMVIERYSHVMHISSTVTGKLRDDCDCWDALRATMPVGTVSGAPKVRAMQIIDELEPTRRGPYAGAVGYVDFADNMDMAIALRTMVVIPTEDPTHWKVHLQAGAGIVADSVPANEYDETVNKAAALAKAIDMAEAAFNAES